MTITADTTALMRQAPMTVDGYLRDAVESIDRQFGQGYAKEHPELVAAFIRACGQDFTTAVVLKTVAGSVAGSTQRR